MTLIEPAISDAMPPQLIVLDRSSSPSFDQTVQKLQKSELSEGMHEIDDFRDI